MKIVLIGYGKMGKAIDAIIEREGVHEVVLRITRENAQDLTIENLQKADVAIEFTQPKAAYHNILKCFEAKIPVVIGTTAWLDKLEEIKARCNEADTACMVSSNYSIGVNLFFALNRKLAEMMKSQEQYLVRMQEIHHMEKKDAPSGTAVSLANDLLPILHKEKWILKENNAAAKDHEIEIEALREPNVPGTHSVFYTSAVDEIEIKHTAKSREGFASGAIKAAEFIAHKKGFYTMSDLFAF
jgi:4-hydroxy-tetrahydrodipicolinate reductase